jgi:hypothetical protein
MPRSEKGPALYLAGCVLVGAALGVGLATAPPADDAVAPGGSAPLPVTTR